MIGWVLGTGSGGAGGKLLATGQTTCYAIGDDGDQRKGIAKAYSVLTTGAYSGTVNLDVPHYAANGISFAATTPGTISDAAAGLATFLTGDTIVVKGSASNDGVYTVSTGGVAGTIRTTEATLLEGAGAYISLYKRTAHSNNAVLDLNTGLMWARYTSSAEKVGVASDGKLNWHGAAACSTLHPAAADLAMVAGNILRVTGSDESARYHAGDVLVCSGFANAVNKLPDLVVVSCSFVGGNTDIVVDPGNQVLIAEAAAGVRDIKLVCRSIYGYAAAARAANLGGYTDWRVAQDADLLSIRAMKSPTAVPDTTAFPGWPTATMWSATSKPNGTQSQNIDYNAGSIPSLGQDRTSNYLCVLVRGGG